MGKIAPLGTGDHIDLITISAVNVFIFLVIIFYPIYSILPPGGSIEDNGQIYKPFQQQTVPVAEGGTVTGAGRYANYRLPDGEVYGITCRAGFTSACAGDRHIPLQSITAGGHGQHIAGH